MRIAMLLHKSVEHDSRVRRAGRGLVDAGHEVTVLHLPRRPGELDGELDGFRVRSVTPPTWVRERLPTAVYRAVFLAAFVLALLRLRPDAVHAHDAAMLAPGWLGARATGADLVYDSHELATGVPYREALWGRGIAALERFVVPRCRAVITVSEGIAARLERRYSLPRRPAVVRNLPDPAETDPDFEAPDLRERLGLGAGTPLVLHLGATARDRGCESLVRAMASAPGAHLLFLGAEGDYADSLAGLAQAEGLSGRIHFLPPVPVAEIRAHVRQADVGVSLLEDTCENHRLALPNKVFEYLAAGIPVVAADLPELHRLLAEAPGARLADPADPEAVGSAIREAIELGDAALPAPESWEAEGRRLASVYEPAAAAGSRSPERALVLVRNGVSHDARILREARLLDSLGYDVTVAGVLTARDRLPREEIDGIRVVRLDPAGGLRRMLSGVRRRPAPDLPSSGGVEAAAGGAARPASASWGGTVRRLAATAAYYRSGLGLVRGTRPALIHANDYNTAWIGVIGKRLTGARLVYDSHELWPDRNLRPEPRGWLLLCEALFVRVADEVITTSPGYAEVLARRYRIERPRVVRNIPEWRAAGGGGGRDEPPLAVYFGAITRSRGLLTALRALPLVPGLRMRFVGPEAWGYRHELSRLAEELGVADRLELLDPVPPGEAPSVLSDADLGLALIEPTCLSYRMTLPNKLFEYVAAGLPVLAGEGPVLAAAVRESGVGRVTDPGDPEKVAGEIQAMLAPAAQRRYREAAERTAAEVTWEAERERLAAVYRPRPDQASSSSF
jgi:glycosyltransferase involved in cell wall biosynthesis